MHRMLSVENPSWNNVTVQFSFNSFESSKIFCPQQFVTIKLGNKAPRFWITKNY